MLIKERFASTLELQRDNIICPDGGKTGIFVKFQGSFEFTTLDYMYVIAGEVSLDWANDEISKNLPNDAPILGILHTITGSARQNVGFMRYAASRGWRSCVLNRRGHSGMPLRVPYFSIMGNVDDTVLLVNQMRQSMPGINPRLFIRDMENSIFAIKILTEKISFQSFLFEFSKNTLQKVKTHCSNN